MKISDAKIRFSIKGQTGVVVKGHPETNHQELASVSYVQTQVKPGKSKRPSVLVTYTIHCSRIN